MLTRVTFTFEKADTAEMFEQILEDHDVRVSIHLWTEGTGSASVICSGSPEEITAALRVAVEFTAA